MKLVIQKAARKVALSCLPIAHLSVANSVTAPAGAQCLEQRISPATVENGDAFGGPIAISGDTMIIGASWDDVAGFLDAGSAYIYIRHNGAWAQEAQLFASIQGFGYHFGRGVALDGDTAIVGAHRALGSGTAYVFVRTNGIWTEQARLRPSDGQSGDHFGVNVAIDGNIAVVGSSADDTSGGADAGSVYIFERVGESWAEVAHILASDGAPNDHFGWSVGIAGDTVLVGAYLDDTVAGNNSGSAYVFGRNGSVWEEQARLFASNAAGDYQFGFELAIADDSIVVGAPGGESGSFYAYYFERSGTTWFQRAPIFNPNGSRFERFGDGVAIAGDTVVIGATEARDNTGDSAGKAYIYRRFGEAWSLEGEMTAASDPDRNDYFGWGVALFGDWAVIGAAGGIGDNVGAVYSFDISCCIGDLTENGVIDLEDVALLLANFGTLEGASPSTGDWDGDNDVDVQDLAMLLSRFGTNCP